MKTMLTTLVALSILSGCIIYVGDDDGRDLQREERTLRLEAADLQKLQANTGAGGLDIVGEADRSNIEVVATIYYYEANDIQLFLHKNGSTAELEANTDGSYSRANNHTRIDLLVKVPASMALNLHDGSGGTTIHDINANVFVDDGSGELVINQIIGDVDIIDGSGNLVVKQITGNVSIKDGSGNLQVSHVSGLVTIDDGSGNISIDDAGSLRLINSGSGNVKLSEINGLVSADH